MRIITNNHPRPILSSFELEQHEFDELSEFEQGQDSFVRYKGMLLNLSEFILTDINSFWTASYGLTNTASIILHLNADNESVILGIAT